MMIKQGLFSNVLTISLGLKQNNHSMKCTVVVWFWNLIFDTL